MSQHALVSCLLLSSCMACKSSPPEPSTSQPDLEVTRQESVDALATDAGPQAPPVIVTDMHEDIPIEDAGAADKEHADMSDYKIPTKFTHVFIGRPQYKKGQVCKAYEKWEKEGSPPPVHDATIFANRHYVTIEEIEVVHGPAWSESPLSRRRRTEGDETTSSIVVRFPLTHNAFERIEPLPFDSLDTSPYGKRMCPQIDTLLAHRYVVLAGYTVYEDYGNSGRIPGSWDDLGVDPTGPHKGFDTLAEAKEYAAKLQKEP